MAADAPAASFVASVKPLLQSHCIDCHGPDEAQAGLRLDLLKDDFRNQETAAKWIRIHDRIVAGEMPPKSSPRPPQAQIAAAATWLDRHLHAASLERQQKKGRVMLRRLNGVEYENTVRTLVGTNVSLRDMLPEENSVAGFDNVSAALDFSATHLLIYQEAAEKAILSAIPPHPPVPFADRRTGREMSQKGPNFQQTLTRSCYLKGDALIVYSKLPRYGLCASAPVPAAGRYRISMSVAAVGEERKPIPVAFGTVGSGREPPTVREIRDIPHGGPQVIEFDFDMDMRQAFVVNVLNLWDIRQFKRPIEEYTGPGLIIEWLKVDGPVQSFPPDSYKQVFGDVPLKPRSIIKAESEGRKPPPIPANRTVQNWLFDPLIPTSDQPKEDAEKLIRSFIKRAFRRPVSEELQQHYVSLVLRKLDEKDSFLDAMLFGFKGILSSPHFLLFMEPGDERMATGEDLASTRLDNFAVANRLAYFLWSSPPDDELLAVAGKGTLIEPAILHAQVERMLASPLAHRFTENFCGQWLDLRKMDATIPDPQLYSDFDGVLLWSMPRETHLFFEEILKHDRSLLEFVDSDWSMLNTRLAELYGIPGVDGNEFRKVQLPADSHRGGVMTQASVLKVTADGTRTSPVLRGKWVLEKIIGKPPAPPPPDIPAIEPDIRGATTIRQQLDKHRNIAVCASCHVHIDPPGFALESYDPIGGFREFYRVTARTPAGAIRIPNSSGRPVYRGPDIELGGVTHDGRKFATIEEYKQLLLTDKDQIARNLAEKMLVCSTGADIQYADREVVDGIIARLKTKNYGFRTLVHEVAQSRIFLNK